MSKFLIFLYSFLVSGLVFLGIAGLHSLPKSRGFVLAGLAFLLYAASFLIKLPFMAQNILIIAGAIGLGFGLSSFLGKKVNLIAFCITASLVDVLSFSGGLTAKINADFAAGASDILSHLAIFTPRAGGIRPLIGIGDLIIMASINSSFLGLGVPKFTAFSVPFLGLVVALVFGIVFGGIFGIPFIALATISYLIIYRKSFGSVG